MARAYKVEGDWATNGTLLVQVLDCTAEDWDFVKSTYAEGNCDLVISPCDRPGQPSRIIAWEVPMGREFYEERVDLRLKDIEPDATFYSEEFAPEGCRLFELFRRIYEKSQSPALSAGVGT